MYRKLAPQKVEHSDGYIVQVADRSSVEYVEGTRRAVIEVEFAELTGVSRDTLRGWFESGADRDMSSEERVTVLERMVTGLEAMGCSVELC